MSFRKLLGLPLVALLFVASAILLFASLETSRALAEGAAWAAPPAAVVDAGGPADAAPADLLGTSPSAAGVAEFHAEDLEGDPIGFVRRLYEAGRSGAYRVLATGLLVLVVWASRKWGPHVFKGDRGGAALALIVGIAGAFATALASQAPIGWGLVYDGIIVGMTGAGGFVVVKRLLWPKDDAAGQPS